jgi:hypothetical protein
MHDRAKRVRLSGKSMRPEKTLRVMGPLWPHRDGGTDRVFRRSAI